jgi:HlyD family secretion protein
MTDRSSRRTASRGRIAWLSLVLLAAGSGTGLGVLHWGRRSHAVDLARLPRAVVQRADLHATLRAPGRVESSERTLIECEIEALSVSNRYGSSITAKGSTTILSIIPDGATVQKGDVLCELDSSDYVELVRQQKIDVEQARADFEAARLDLESEEIALREYREGLLKQQREQYESQISLAQADLKRQEDRLDWARKMAKIGYIPDTRLSAEQSSLERIRIQLQQTLLGQSNLDRFVAPRTITTLESRISGARSRMTYLQLRLTRQEERLAHFEAQIDRCTVRAPHDGFVIYANEDDRDTRIELGAVVRQKQDLFYLPDLKKMEVQTLLNQSIVNRVKEGQPALVRVEALPTVRLEGHVTAVAPLPETVRSWRVSDEIKNFIGRIKLHSVPEGLRPGMTAEVEILTEHRPRALVVPPEAIAYEDGQQVCYIAGPEGPVRREVAIGQYTPEMIEIESGLSEGDEVLLNPADLKTGELSYLFPQGGSTTGLIPVLWGE